MFYLKEKNVLCECIPFIQDAMQTLNANILDYVMKKDYIFVLIQGLLFHMIIIICHRLYVVQLLHQLKALVNTYGAGDRLRIGRMREESYSLKYTHVRSNACIGWERGIAFLSSHV